MGLTIRLAAPADVTALLALYKALDVGDEPSLPEETARRRFAELGATPGHSIYVAEDEGRIVGTFALVFIGGLPHSGRPSSIVEDVVVVEVCRGRGIGRAMMQYAMRASAAAGCYKLALSSHLRRVEAHRFYEGLGFRRHGYSFLIEGDAA